MFILNWISTGSKPFPLVNHRHKKSVKHFVQVQGRRKNYLCNKKAYEYYRERFSFLPH